MGNKFIEILGNFGFPSAGVVIIEGSAETQIQIFGEFSVYKHFEITRNDRRFPFPIALR